MNSGSGSNQWFKNDMFQFAGSNVPRLPHDHHELMAMAIVQNANISILTRGLSPGTYMIRMQGNGIIQRKIVVQ